MSRKRARFPLRWKLTLYGGALASLPLLVAGWLLLDVNEEAVRRGALQLQIALADDLGRTLESELGGTRATLTAVARALGDPSLPEEARLSVAMRLVESSRLPRVAVFDGRRAWIDAIVPERETSSAPPMAAPTQLPDDWVHVPIVARGQTTGFVGAPYPSGALGERVDALHASHLALLGGSLAVTRRDGVSLAAAGDEAALERATADLDPRDVSAPVSREVEGAVVTWAPLGPRAERLGVAVLSVPRAVAFRSLVRMKTIVGVGIGVAMLLALAFAAGFARRLTAPIGRLSAFASALAERRFGERVEVASSDELAGLAEDLTTASEALAASEERVRVEEAIRADLERFLPAEVARRVAAREHDMDLGGRRVPITVLFADVVAFTPLTSRLPPEEVVGILNELFTLLTEVVFRHGGTVDKFVGDAVMALFGAPEPSDAHAAEALRAAEDMLAFVEAANEGWERRFGVRIQLAIGVHTGEAVVGNLGSDVRMEYTAIGQAVNVAARLEAMARPQQILVSEATRDAAGDEFDFAPVGEQKLAGIDGAIALFEVRT